MRILKNVLPAAPLLLVAGCAGMLPNTEQVIAPNTTDDLFLALAADIEALIAQFAWLIGMFA